MIVSGSSTAERVFNAILQSSFCWICASRDLSGWGYWQKILLAYDLCTVVLNPATKWSWNHFWNINWNTSYTNNIKWLFSILGGHLECEVTAAEEKASFSFHPSPSSWPCCFCNWLETHAQQTFSSTPGRKLTWRLEGRGCFCDGWVKQLTGEVKVWQKGKGERCALTSLFTGAQPRKIQLSSTGAMRGPLVRDRDGLVCTVRDNGVLTASNPTFYFCKDASSTTVCHEEKCFSTLKVSAFSSFKKTKQTFSKLMKVNGKSNSVLKHNSDLGQETRPSFRVNGNSKFSRTWRRARHKFHLMELPCSGVSVLLLNV